MERMRGLLFSMFYLYFLWNDNICCDAYTFDDVSHVIALFWHQNDLVFVIAVCLGVILQAETSEKSYSSIYVRYFLLIVLSKRENRCHIFPVTLMSLHMSDSNMPKATNTNKSVKGCRVCHIWSRNARDLLLAETNERRKKGENGGAGPEKQRRRKQIPNANYFVLVNIKITAWVTLREGVPALQGNSSRILMSLQLFSKYSEAKCFSPMILN